MNNALQFLESNADAPLKVQSSIQLCMLRLERLILFLNYYLHFRGKVYRTFKSNRCYVIRFNTKLGCATKVLLLVQKWDSWETRVSIKT